MEISLVHWFLTNLHVWPLVSILFVSKIKSLCSEIVLNPHLYILKTSITSCGTFLTIITVMISYRVGQQKLYITTIVVWWFTCTIVVVYSTQHRKETKIRQCDVEFLIAIMHNVRSLNRLNTQCAHQLVMVRVTMRCRDSTVVARPSSTCLLHPASSATWQSSINDQSYKQPSTAVEQSIIINHHH